MVYLGEIKTVKFYDVTKQSLISQPSYESNYHNCMYLPQVGTKIKFDSRTNYGIYEVTDWLYDDNTCTLTITVKKID